MLLPPSPDLQGINTLDWLQYPISVPVRQLLIPDSLSLYSFPNDLVISQSSSSSKIPNVSIYRQCPQISFPLCLMIPTVTSPLGFLYPKFTFKILDLSVFFLIPSSLQIQNRGNHL